MLNIRGMSIVGNFLTGVYKFGHGLTFEVTGLARLYAQGPVYRWVMRLAFTPSLQDRSSSVWS